MWGAICGDIIGSVWEFSPIKTTDFELLSPSSHWTDDTVCTIAIADAILNRKDMEKTMVEWVQNWENAGYGLNFLQWALAEERAPYGSWGNGSAMRVSSVAWLAKDMEEVVGLAQQSASFSHNNPHGIRGAKATAIAVRMSLEGWSKQEIKELIEDRFGYDLSRTPDQIRPNYKFHVSCQRSVPEALCCFLAANDWEETARLCVSLGGDADTQAAIAGSVAEPMFGIPKEVKERCRKRLPEEFKPVIASFDQAVEGKKWSKSDLSVIKKDINQDKSSFDEPDKKLAEEMRKIAILEKSIEDVQLAERGISFWQKLFSKK